LAGLSSALPMWTRWQSHLHLLFFGADSGPRWLGSGGLNARKTSHGLCCRSAAYPGCGFYQEHAWLGWKRFSDLSHLRRLVLPDLGRFLLSHTERYGMTLVEAESLRSFIAKLGQPEPSAIPGQATGAAGGGVILAPGKDQPPGARLVGEQ
jgi:hypothetical protein